MTDLLAVDLEYRLTIAARVAEECECAPYLIARRLVLVPAVLEQAEKDGADPVDVFAAFARRVHQRHEAGLPLLRRGPSRLAGRFAALMSVVSEEAS